MTSPLIGAILLPCGAASNEILGEGAGAAPVQRIKSSMVQVRKIRYER
jgi:hypothetical protein